MGSSPSSASVGSAVAAVAVQRQNSNAAFMADLLKLWNLDHWRFGKTAAIRARRHAERAKECAPQRLGSTESTFRSDRLDAFLAFLEPAAGGLESHPLNEARGSRPHAFDKGAGKVARAHRRAARQNGHREILREMVRHPRLQLGEGRAVGGLDLKLGAELRLPAGALQEEHQLARHGAAQRRPMILGDQREREIHSCSDARGRVEAPLAHEDRIRIDAEARRRGWQACRSSPSGW